MKKCPHLLRSDHRELRKSYVKLMWWVVGGGGGMRPNTATSRSFAFAFAFVSTTLSISIDYMFLKVDRSVEDGICFTFV